LDDLPLRAEVQAAVQDSEPEVYGGAAAVTTPIEVGRQYGSASAVSAGIGTRYIHSDTCASGVGGRGGAPSLCSRRLAAALRPVNRRN
jgi:hypothetical protein